MFNFLQKLFSKRHMAINPSPEYSPWLQHAYPIILDILCSSLESLLLWQSLQGMIKIQWMLLSNAIQWKGKLIKTSLGIFTLLIRCIWLLTYDASPGSLTMKSKCLELIQGIKAATTVQLKTWRRGPVLPQKLAIRKGRCTWKEGKYFEGSILRQCVLYYKNF